MESMGVIEKVFEPTEWVSSMLAVKKTKTESLFVYRPEGFKLCNQA